ncbi:MAG: AbrB/MazE/SpoVT family DNA-binding domain-containing protein [Acutalibacteraceae bacterium]|jgi:bifunctional DNA-binding transcriptional regulator/antitoxin component of YhaV-PrlF toxin-antitoxin module
MSTVVDPKNHLISDKKIVSISSKRQITIPRKFFDALNFADEAECVVRGNELILRPARTNSGGEFAEHILADLIASGLTGEELLREFKNRQAKVRPAIEAMIAEADKVAVGNGEYYTYDDVFGTGK